MLKRFFYLYYFCYLYPLLHLAQKKQIYHILKTHIRREMGTNKSVQTSYRVKSEKLSRFIQELRKLKQEKNNEPPTIDEILNIITNINESPSEEELMNG